MLLIKCVFVQLCECVSCASIKNLLISKLTFSRLVFEDISALITFNVNILPVCKVRHPYCAGWIIRTSSRIQFVSSVPVTLDMST